MSEELSKRITSCCNRNSEDVVEEQSLRKDQEDVRKTVRKQYSEIVSSSPGNDQSPFYSKEELQSIPKDANLGLGSGNPVAIASIKPGEVIVDLGAGAGIDCFLAAQKTGATGKVIGIDMTPKMIDKARANAKQSGYTNVEFRLGEIEYIPVADNSADLVISNCVINLSPEKTQVFKDAYRILKPGGRLMVSDIILGNELPKVVKQAFEGTVSCVSRAWLSKDYLDAIRSAGFEEVEVVDQKIISPRNSPQEVDGKKKRKLLVYSREIEIELTPDEDESLQKSILTAHIKAIKPN